MYNWYLFPSSFTLCLGNSVLASLDEVVLLKTGRGTGTVDHHGEAPNMGLLRILLESPSNKPGGIKPTILWVNYNMVPFGIL